MLEARAALIDIDNLNDSLKAMTEGNAREIMEWSGQWWVDAIRHHVSIVGPPRSLPDEYPRIDTGQFYDGMEFTTHYDTGASQYGYTLIFSSDEKSLLVDRKRPTFQRAAEEDWELFEKELGYYTEN